MSERFYPAFPSLTLGGKAIRPATTPSWTMVHTVPPGDEGSFDEVTIYAGNSVFANDQWIEVVVGLSTSDPGFFTSTGKGLETVMLGHRMRPGESIWCRAQGGNPMLLVEINRGSVS